MEQLRNKKGQFAKAETVFMSPRMQERHEEWNRTSVEQAPALEASVTPEQARSNELAHNAMWEIETIREELRELTTDITTKNEELTTIKLPELEGGAEMRILGDKLLKRKQKEVKEKSPQSYTEMLVVFNDTQLLKACDQEALGAFLKYVDANKNRITHVIANGDILDFTAQSFFEKSLDQMNSANDEIEAGKWLFGYINKTLPNAKKVFIQGNHSARWSNMIDAAKGNEPWIKTMDEMFELKENGWENIPYGEGQYYRWHDRVFWHGHRSGSKSHIAKLEMQDAGVSVTTAHINKNQFHEEKDALGRVTSGIVHAGFSLDKLGFMKTANTNWTEGFGVYYWDKKVGEQPYSVLMKHGNPRFISPDGEIFDGTGWKIPGFEPVRGRPRKG